MCTGRSPFRAESVVATMRRVCDDTPRPIREVNPDIPERLAAIIDKLLAKNSDDRFQTAQEVADLLGRYLAHLQHPASTPPPDVPGPRPPAEATLAVAPRVAASRPAARRRWPRRAVGVAATALLGICLLIAVTEATGITNFAATILRITTGTGTLVVQVDDPQVSVAIDGEELVITGAGPKELRLKPGDYEVQATKDGRLVKQELVTIQRGGRQVVSVHREPKAEVHRASVSPPGEGNVDAPSQAIREIRKFAGAGSVGRVAFTPDGRFLLGASGHELHVWETETGHLVRSMQAGGQIISLEISPDGRYAATGLNAPPRALWKGEQPPKGAFDVIVWEIGAGQMVHRLSGHAGEPYGLAFSTDGKRLFTFAVDNTLREWDLQRGQLLKTHPRTSIRSHVMAVLPGGDRLLMPVNQTTLEVIDGGSGIEIRDFLVSHERLIQGLDVSADAALAVSSEDGTIRICDVAGGREVRRIDTGDYRPHRVKFVPGSRYVVSTGADTTGGLWSVRLWDVASGAEFARWASRDATVQIAVSSSGCYVAACGGLENGTTGPARLLELPPSVWAPADADTEAGWVSLFNGRDLTGWKTHPDCPWGWTVENGVLVGRPDPPRYLFSERGDFENFHLRIEAKINEGGDSGIFFRTEYGLNGKMYPNPFPLGYEACIYAQPNIAKQTGTLRKPPRDLVPFEKMLVPPGTWFTLEVVASGNHIVIKVNGQVTADCVDEDQPYTNGHLALQTLRAGCVVQFRKIEIKELPPGDVEDDATAPSGLSDYEVRRFVGQTAGVQSICVLPDGKRMVSGGDEKALRVWDLETGAELRRLEGRSREVRSVAALPDGRRLVSGSWDRTVRIWDIEAGGELKTLTAHLDQVWGVAALPDGKRFVSASSDGTVRIWDVDSGKQVGMLDLDQPVCSVAALPDGRHVLCGDEAGVVQLWDLDKSSLVRRFEGHTDYIKGLAVSPDGRRALSAGATDGTVRLWDLQTGEELRKFEGHGAQAHGGAFSRDGKLSLTCGSGVVFLWDLETGRKLRTFRAPGQFTGAAFLPDGLHAVSASWDGPKPQVLRLWELPESVWPEDAVVERLAQVSKSIEANPDAELFHQRGRLYVRLGRFDEAARDFIRANELLASRRGWDETSGLFDSLMQHEEVFARIAELRPDDLSLWAHRGHYYALRGQWERALPDYAKASEKPLGQFEYAGVLLLTGDEEGYRRVCDRMVERFSQTAQPEAAFQSAHICVLSPRSGIDAEQMIRWAELRDRARRDGFSLFVLGAASYRVGHFEKAVEYFREANELPDASKSAFAFPFALALHQLGRSEESREWYRRGVVAWRNEEPQGPEDPAGWAVSHWLNVCVWHREAEAVFGPLKDEVPASDDLQTSNVAEEPNRRPPDEAPGAPETDGDADEKGTCPAEGGDRPSDETAGQQPEP